VYDVIVVGARCAGSALGRLLARQGHRVLIVDRATFPSDIFRNHFVRRRGALRLQRWGLLDQVEASNCPPIRKYTVELGDFPLTGYPPGADGLDAEYAPRRYVLDQILLEAAVEAGAEVRAGVVVEDLLRDGDRVAGIRARQRRGQPFEERARLVVGADGQYSLVARTVGAAKYQAHPPLTCGFYSYFQGTGIDGLEVYLSFEPGRQRAIISFPTNDDTALVAVQWPVSVLPRLRAEAVSLYWQTLDEVPAYGARIRAARRTDRWYAATDLANFLRVPAGPGWALVGDAGHHKDPIYAQGISDAFEHAELLAEAIHAGLSGEATLDAALARYARQRDESARANYEGTLAGAAFQPPPPMVHQLRAALRGHQADIDGFYGADVGTVPAEQFFAPENVQRILARSAEAVPAADG